MRIEISKYYIDKCIKFAEDQLETSKDLYAYRGEYRYSKMKDDIIIGKLGEVAAYQYLKKLGYKATRPDFKIYETKRKSFDADLKTNCGLEVHVKTQGYSSLLRYGASWLFQKSDSVTVNPSDFDHILMVSIREGQAEILGTVSCQDLVSYKLFEQPKVERYAHTKLALYLDSIKQKGVSLNSIQRSTNES